MLFVTGLRIDSAFADLATLIHVRQRPKDAGATFQGNDAKNIPGESATHAGGTQT